MKKNGRVWRRRRRESVAEKRREDEGFTFWRRQRRGKFVLSHAILLIWW
jgi:hypothetical protein